MKARATYLRRVITIRAEDSPNVRLALDQQERGKAPTGESLLPGVLSWDEYCQRRKLWDEERQCIGLDAKFYVGQEVMWYPPAWLNRANGKGRELARPGGQPRQAEGLGIDSAEGGDNTSMCAVDRLGIIELVSKKTRDTNVIVGEAAAFIQKHRCDPENVCFDRGGGGKQHADRLRADGLKVRTIAFGESLMMEPKMGMRLIEERLENREERYVYVNRRAQMYGDLSNLLDPASDPWGIYPASWGPQYERLLFQLSKMPKLIDDKGRYWLPSKGTRTDQMKKRNIKTLIEIIGHSPDEADALVLAVHGMTYQTWGSTAKVYF